MNVAAVKLGLCLGVFALLSTNVFSTALGAGGVPTPLCAGAMFLAAWVGSSEERGIASVGLVMTWAMLYCAAVIVVAAILWRPIAGERMPLYPFVCGRIAPLSVVGAVLFAGAWGIAKARRACVRDDGHAGRPRSVGREWLPSLLICLGVAGYLGIRGLQRTLLVDAELAGRLRVFAAVAPIPMAGFLALTSWRRRPGGAWGRVNAVVACLALGFCLVAQA